MKKLLTLFVLIPIFAAAQKSEVVIDSVDSKEVIFSKSLLWVAKTWKNANNVIQLKDEASGTIVVKGGMKAAPRTLGIPADGSTLTTLTILVKDGKAKLTFENTIFKAPTSIWEFDGSTKGYKAKWNKEVIEEQEALIENYKTSLNKKVDDF